MPRHRWKNNITMDLEEVAWRCMDWTGLAQDVNSWLGFVHMVMNPWVQ